MMALPVNEKTFLEHLEGTMKKSRDAADAIFYEKQYQDSIMISPTYKHPVAKTPNPGKITFDARSSAQQLREDQLYTLLAMRLRIPEGQRFPFDHLSMHVTDDKAFVFVVNKGQPVMIEDDPAMFPSDTLIGQLIVLKG